MLSIVRFEYIKYVGHYINYSPLCGGRHLRFQLKNSRIALILDIDVYRVFCSGVIYKNNAVSALFLCDFSVVFTDILFKTCSKFAYLSANCTPNRNENISLVNQPNFSPFSWFSASYFGYF